MFLLRLLALLGVSLLAVRGRAATSHALPIDLAWEGPVSCPASDDIEHDVRLLLGDAPLPPTLPPIAARVSVRQNTDGRFEVSLVTTSGGETRERVLSTETCDEARDLVAFLLALLIDPRAREPAPNVATAPSKPPAVAPERAPPPRPAPANGLGGYWVVGWSGSAELGMLPGGSVGGVVRVGLRSSGWSLEGRGGAWLPRHAESTEVPGAGGTLTLFEAGLVGCWSGAPGGAPSLQLCAGPILLLLEGEGYGVQAPGQDEAIIGGATVEAALLIAISARLSLRPALGVLVPFRRPTFALHDVGTIHRPSAVAARALLGFEARF